MYLKVIVIWYRWCCLILSINFFLIIETFLKNLAPFQYCFKQSLKHLFSFPLFLFFKIIWHFTEQRLKSSGISLGKGSVMIVWLVKILPKWNLQLWFWYFLHVWNLYKFDIPGPSIIHNNNLKRNFYSVLKISCNKCYIFA